jgi:RsiW-degrading membrane proteinase PrsW (M82 family)/RNA polymerase subunit RPABC4/transcription elongation factor Spt4
VSDGPAPEVPSLVTCDHCGATVPAGAFCGNCGGHLGEGGSRDRSASYAASPHEHVLRSSLITTLFPHLPHRQAHVFREVFVVGIGVVVLLAALQLVAPATLVAVLLLPVLYLLYLYESEVYETEPVQVVGLTLVAGGALGYLYVVIADSLTTATTTGTSQGPLVTGLLLPLIAQLLMLAGPLLLLTRRRFHEILDGLTFGVASALGFTMVSVVAASWHFFTAPLVGGVPTDDVLRIIRSAILAGVVHAGTTGIITAALWLRVHQLPAAGIARPVWRSLPAAIAAALLVELGLGVASYFMPSILGLVILWAGAAALMLVLVRVVLHFGLLEESVEHATGPLVACGECHRMVADMIFCPNCGAAANARPKHSRAARPGEDAA